MEKDARSVLSLRACGLIHTEKDLPLPARLAYVYEQTAKVLALYAPAQVAMEQNYFLKRAQTMAHTVMARGVILLACEQAGKTVTFYEPKRVKLLITGSGAADKKQVQRMVQLTLHLKEPPQPDDTADAVAIAICHLKTGALASKLNVKTAFLEKLKAARQAQLKKKSL